jgi:predicted nucleic acid-binding protein
VLAAIRNGSAVWISSTAIELEIDRNPSPLRRAAARSLLSFATIKATLHDSSLQRARHLAYLGYEALDALHLAAAESAEASVLLTTDDRFLRRAALGLGQPRIPVRNPLSWIKEVAP